MPRKSVFIATQDDTVNVALLSENRPIPFKPFQSARFLITKEDGLEEKMKHKIVVMSKMEGFEQIMIPFAFSDYAGRHNGKILIPQQAAEQDTTSPEDATIFKNFTTPLVLSGKKAYIVCSANGALSAHWNWMGARYDNGGLYVPPARAFGRITVEISVDDGVRKRLPNFVVSSRHENGVLRTRHELAGLEVKRTLTVPFENRGFIMLLQIGLTETLREVPKRKKKKEKKSSRRIRIHFLIDGNITSYGLAAVSRSIVTKFDETYNCLQLSTAPERGVGTQYLGTIGIAPRRIKPARVLTDAFDNNLELSYDFEVKAGREPVKIALVGTGSFTSQADCTREYLFMTRNYERLVQDTEKGFKQFSSSMLTMKSSPGRNSTLLKLLMAYEKAKTCLRYLKAEYDGLGEGVCAGLPRFPNYWARDTGWALRGYLGIGDYKFAASTIDNFLRRQARMTTKDQIKGELPMIISGKAFLHMTTYGSADSTFLFPWAIQEYVLATGDIVFLQKRWKAIVNLIEWGFLKDIDNDGLLENDFTGTAEMMPIQDSTWMDHIDRRKSANDIQALFYESLTIGGRLAALVGEKEVEKRWTEKARHLKEKINVEYWNQQGEFYYDTIRKDGSRDPSIRPNALVLLLTDAVSDRNRAEAVLSRVEQSDMTTSWGVRTLSSSDPRYDPALYHDGAVWPLVTGWAAMSEIKFGRTEQALRYLGSMADRILAENGMFAETYRGDRPEPFNSCILQAWSVGMYAYAFREMMLGLSVDMTRNEIRIEPNIPQSLRDPTCPPIDFEVPLAARRGIRKLNASIDIQKNEIMVSIDGAPKPKVSSKSYSITIKN